MRLLFCGSGWLPIVDHIAARLPDGSSIDHWDRDEPLASAIRHVDVLLPSNASITADVIGAATHLRLIQQPAAGTEQRSISPRTRSGCEAAIHWAIWPPMLWPTTTKD